jgi:two-component system OmpR family response regulator
MNLTPLSRILFVEDDPDIQAVARMALELVGGFTVVTCSSGQEALQQAPTVRADLILLDVMMPGMDGPTTLKELRGLTLTATTPVIFMTAKVQPQERAYYESLGAVGVIAKPFDPMGLSTTIQEIWSAHHA